MVYAAGSVNRTLDFAHDPYEASLRQVELNCTGPLGLAGAAQIAVYSAVKASPVNLGEGLWAEMSPRGVDVCTAVLGQTWTPALERTGAAYDPETDMLAGAVADEIIANIANGPTYVVGARNQATASGRPGNSNQLYRERTGNDLPTGEEPPVVEERTLRFATCVKPSPESPPAAVSYGAKVHDWPMYCNDQYGDLLSVLNYWRWAGVDDHKVLAFTSLDLKDQAQAKSACWLFGGVYIGVELPDFTTPPTQDNWLTIPWTVPPGGRSATPRRTRTTVTASPRSPTTTTTSTSSRGARSRR